MFIQRIDMVENDTCQYITRRQIFFILFLILSINVNKVLINIFCDLLPVMRINKFIRIRYILLVFVLCKMNVRILYTTYFVIL